ncbi:MAG: phage antirepressor protein [Deltaproteobacteria bacterium]|nr:phage antirepressor protein [Candidatus Tharpella aukensis]
MNMWVDIFKGNKIRRILYNDEWWFSVVDVCGVLTGSVDPGAYWCKLEQRLKKEGSKSVTNCDWLNLEAADGKQYLTVCANADGIFRIIQSISSPKAELFKRWLAQVGYERMQEIENPELAAKRCRALYRAKGYSDGWIEKRMRGIVISAVLADEWKDRDVGSSREYDILTAEIFKATFGLTPSEYKNLKQLERENLRDHMGDLELIFSMLGEAATTEITRTQDAQGFSENCRVANKGGRIAGDAREKLEKKSGRTIRASVP